jgi:uncharacterized membrane protein YecN with MAPEG domain
MSAPVTAVYAAAAALLVLFLAGNVVRYRRRLRVGLGSGGHDALNVAVRAHANAVETLPIALLLLLLLELNGAAAGVLHAAGVVLLAARIGHAQGLLMRGGGTSNGRFFGTLGTWLVLVAMALGLLLQALA